jgi:hypothetical protein
MPPRRTTTPGALLLARWQAYEKRGIAESTCDGGFALVALLLYRRLAVGYHWADRGGRRRQPHQ